MFNCVFNFKQISYDLVIAENAVQLPLILKTVGAVRLVFGQHNAESL